MVAQQLPQPSLRRQHGTDPPLKVRQLTVILSHMGLKSCRDQAFTDGVEQTPHFPDNRKGSRSLNNLPSATSRKEHVQVGTLLGATTGALIGQESRVDLLELLQLSNFWCSFTR
ncbi:hypothetical protein Tco_1306051 [Tanacetum coccineum]